MIVQLIRLVVVTLFATAVSLFPARLQAQSRVVVPSAPSGTVQVVDLDSGAVAGSLSAGGDAYGMAVQRDGRRSYAAVIHAGNVSAIDTEAPAVTTAGLTFTTHGAALSPDGRVLYLAVRDGSQVAVLDALSLTETSRINGMGNPGGVFADPQGRYLAVSNYGLPWVTLTDLASGTQRFVQMPGAGGWGIAGNADGSRLYVQTTGGYLAEIDPLLAATTRSIAISPVFGSVAVTADGARVYVVGQGTDIWSYDTASLSARPPVAAGAAAVDVSPDGSRIWVTRSAAGRLSAYGVGDDALLADYPVANISAALGRFVPQAPLAMAIWDLDETASGLPGEPDLIGPAGVVHRSGAIGKGSVACSASGLTATVPALGANAPFALSMWVRPDVLPLGASLLAGQASNSAPTGWWLGLDGQTLSVHGFSSQPLLGTAEIRARHWQHIVMTADATNVSLYVDGAPAGTAARTSLAASADTFRLCAHPSLGVAAFAGQIDAVALYARSLPAGEVSSLRAASPVVATAVPEPGFESGAVDTTMNAIPGWHFGTFNRSDSGNYGTTPAGSYEARLSSTRRHHGAQSLRSWVRNNSGGGGSDANGRKSTLVMGMRDDLRISTQANALELWRSEWNWTTSSRWYHRLSVSIGDNRTEHSVLLYCRDWGLNEGCSGDFFDGSDASELGADGLTWYRHRVAIPEDLDRDRLWIRFEHQQDSWDGTTAESEVFLDDIRFVGAVPGEELVVANFGDNTVQFYLRDGDGNLSPARSLSGPLTQLNQPNGVAFSDTELFVGNHAGQSILVFPRDASGNVAPTRVIAGSNTGLGLVTHLRVFDDELFVGSYGAALRVFNLSDGGNVAPKRVLNAMTGAYGLVLTDNALIVSRHPDTGDQAIYTYARTANGNDAPIRVLQGQGLNFPASLAVQNGELFVCDYFNSAIRVFNVLASGSTAPLRSFTDTSGLSTPVDHWIRDNELYVAARGSNSLRVYGLNDSGAVTPRRVIAGAATGLNEPLAIVDSGVGPRSELLFRNGFE